MFCDCADLPPPSDTSQFQLFWQSWEHSSHFLHLNSTLFRQIRKTAKNDSFVMSVHPSVCPSIRLHGKTRLPQGQIFMKFDMRVFRKSAGKIHVSLKSDKSNGYFTWRPANVYDNISPNSSESEICFRQKLYRISQSTSYVQHIFF
jgi:hypothetical protein